MEHVKNILIEHSVKPSMQRMLILENLLSRYDHPCAETIYVDLVKSMPTLSRTTVYNTLEVFLENGIVNRLSIDSGQARYDATTALHTHFYCKACGTVSDIEIKQPNLAIPEDYIVNEQQLYLYGICPECKNSGKIYQN